jgi:hypothetical protein
VGQGGRFWSFILATGCAKEENDSFYFFVGQRIDGKVEGLSNKLIITNYFWSLSIKWLITCSLSAKDDKDCKLCL